MNLIGLTGPAGCGKDTVAAMLVNMSGYTKIAFADPLRTMVAVGFSLDDELTDRAKKEAQLPDLGRSPRYLLQTLGTEWGRNLVHPDVWIIALQRRLQALGREGYKRFVISDVRFDNEAKWIVANGGLVVGIQRAAARQVNPHTSEHGVNPELIDHWLDNNGTIEELRLRIWTTKGIFA